MLLVIAVSTRLQLMRNHLNYAHWFKCACCSFHRVISLTNSLELEWWDWCQQRRRYIVANMLKCVWSSIAAGGSCKFRFHSVCFFLRRDGRKDTYLGDNRSCCKAVTRAWKYFLLYLSMAVARFSRRLLYRVCKFITEFQMSIILNNSLWNAPRSFLIFLDNIDANVRLDYIFRRTYFW